MSDEFSGNFVKYLGTLKFLHNLKKELSKGGGLLADT